MPDKTYTAADVAALLDSVSDRGTNGPWTPEDIDRQLQYALPPVPPPLAHGERVMKDGVQGLPEGSRVVSTPGQEYSPQNNASFEIGQTEWLPSPPPVQPDQGQMDPMQELGSERFSGTQPQGLDTKPVVQTPSGDTMDAGQFKDIIQGRMEKNLGWNEPKSSTLEYLLRRSKGQ